MISVCMATYNGEGFLREQIDSILCQLGPEDELIISDDDSTDGTLGIIESYDDSRIRLLHHRRKPEYARIRHSRNFYYATDNFENALGVARGDYIFLSDQDDVWLEGKVEVMLKELQKVDFVMCNYNIIDDKNLMLMEMVIDEKFNFSKGYMLNLFTTPFLGCLIAFRRNVLYGCIPFPHKLIAHDLWIGCIACKQYKSQFLNMVLVNHRKHRGNTSNVNVKSINPIWMKIFYRIILLYQLLSHALWRKRGRNNG